METEVVLYVGGRKNGQIEELDVRDIGAYRKFPLPPEFRCYVPAGALPKLNELKVETYIRTYDFYLDKYIYIEEKEHKERIRLSKIRYHQKEIAKHRKELSELKFKT